MKYDIEQIEGIGEAYGAALRKAGIATTGDLLEKGATAKGRDELAETTGISRQLILKWVNHADLFRINGVAGQFAELLEATGVDTVKELRHRNPENLEKMLIATNFEKHLCRRVPTLKELESIIEQAKMLAPVVTY